MRGVCFLTIVVFLHRNYQQQPAVAPRFASGLWRAKKEKEMRKTGFLAIVMALILVPTVASAATIYVPTGQPTIQAGIDAAVDGDTVLVATGTYVENIDFLGKTITVQSEMGYKTTAIDGSQMGSVVTFVNGESEETLLDGFEIRNGYNNVGGGINCDNYSDPIIANCKIIDNMADVLGGGIHGSLSSLIIQDCQIVNNVAKYGGGICSGTFSSVEVTNCVIQGNIASEYGGGIRHLPISGSGVFTNCVISENVADFGGGVSCESLFRPTFTNCTISNNTAFSSGGGIHFNESRYATLINTILWENSAELQGQEIWFRSVAPDSTLTISYCDVSGGEDSVFVATPSTLLWLDGNVEVDPHFVGGGDYHLTSKSPCINNGTDAGVYTDMDGDVRPHGGGFDLGADEFVEQPPCFIATIM